MIDVIAVAEERAFRLFALSLAAALELGLCNRRNRRPGNRSGSRRWLPPGTAPRSSLHSAALQDAEGGVLRTARCTCRRKSLYSSPGTRPCSRRPNTRPDSALSACAEHSPEQLNSPGLTSHSASHAPTLQLAVHLGGRARVTRAVATRAELGGTRSLDLQRRTLGFDSRRPPRPHTWPRLRRRCRRRNRAQRGPRGERKQATQRRQTDRRAVSSS